MSKTVSTKSYEHLTHYLMALLDKNNEVSISHDELLEVLPFGRTTFIKAVRKMREKDTEWEVTSGGIPVGETTAHRTTYRYLGEK